MDYKFQQLKDSAKGQGCTLRFANVCNWDTSTTVLCHINSEFKGMGNKSPDWFGVFGCSACHEHLDQRRADAAEEAEAVQRALSRTWQTWIGMGLIKLPEVKVKRQSTSNKIMQRRIK